MPTRALWQARHEVCIMTTTPSETTASQCATINHHKISHIWEHIPNANFPQVRSGRVRYFAEWHCMTGLDTASADCVSTIMAAGKFNSKAVDTSLLVQKSSRKI